MWKVTVTKHIVHDTLDHRLQVKVEWPDDEESSSSEESSESSDFLPVTTNIFLLEEGNFKRVCTVPDLVTFPDTPLDTCELVRTNEIDLIFRSSDVLLDAEQLILDDIEELKTAYISAGYLGLP